MDLKERIKDLCFKNNLSMNQLEQELGFGKGYISKLGKSTPNTTKMQLIANRFGVSIDYLMTGKEESANKEPNLTLRDKRLLAYAKELEDLGIGFDELRGLIDAVKNMQKKK